MTNVTLLLTQIEAGDPKAAAELLPLVYDELRRLASQKMSAEKAEHTLQPTALVHEAWLRLVGNAPENDDPNRDWNSRGHFFAAAAEAMRRILIEAARQKASLKRGGDYQRLSIEEVELGSEATDWTNLIALDEALERLQQEDADCYQLVMLRYFSGLTVNEAAEALGVSPRTAKRNWSYARAWLQREIEGSAKGGNKTDSHAGPPSQ